MILTPVNGHILVELPPKETGVYIPESLSDSQQEGHVINSAADITGDLAERLVVGARVRWEKFAEADGSFDIEIDGEKRRATLIKSNQVMGVWS